MKHIPLLSRVILANMESQPEKQEDKSIGMV
jgi:hypothetical protein